MTNFIKRLITGLALAGLVFVTPVLANECGPLGSYEDLQKNAKDYEDQGVKLVTVTESQMKKFIENAGEPPNVDTARPFEAYLLTAPSGLAMLMVVQDGCVKINAGPAALETFQKKMGLLDA